MINYSQLSREELLAELQKAQAQASDGGGLRVSKKGAVSLYGLGRWPVTLYKSQWDALLAKADSIREFIAAESEKGTLAVKPVKEEAADQAE